MRTTASPTHGLTPDQWGRVQNIFRPDPFEEQALLLIVFWLFEQGRDLMVETKSIYEEIEV